MSTTDLEERGIADLFGDLLRAVLGIGRSTARMFGLEAKDVARRFGRRVALLVFASVVAAAGLLLVLGSLAILADRALGLPLWAGLLIVGATALAAGVAAITLALRRLAQGDLAFPETIAELGRDVDALTKSRDEP